MLASLSFELVKSCMETFGEAIELGEGVGHVLEVRVRVGKMVMKFANLIGKLCCKFRRSGDSILEVVEPVVVDMMVSDWAGLTNSAL